jgi:hypothetical protein
MENHTQTTDRACDYAPSLKSKYENIEIFIIDSYFQNISRMCGSGLE